MGKFIPSSFSEYVAAGKMWRLGIDYTSVADGAYTGITFTTPATGQVIVSLSDVQKTGGEVKVYAVEGPTIGGVPTNLTPYNYNRIIGDASPPFTASRQTDTITNGTVIGSKLVGGAAQGNNSAGGASPSSAFFFLKPSTVYYWKFEADQAAVTMMAHLDIIYEDGTML